MSCLLEFKSTFDYRHEFEDDDLEVLKERWPNVGFHNIPTSWIIAIDEMFCKLRYHNPIHEIRQEFGQLVIIHDELKFGQAGIIQEAENKIKAIDIDIHKELECSH